MLVKVEIEANGTLLVRRVGRKRVSASVPLEEILSVERLSSERGFVLHNKETKSLVVMTGKRRRREVERLLRDQGVLIVDRYGARIDESQFEKEADPEFNRHPGESIWPLLRVVLTPNAVLGWRHRRIMRQSSENAEGE
jgi:hypothetical protein